MKRLFNPIVLIGTFASILLALGLYLSDQGEYNSTLIALVGIVITLQLDQVARTEEAVHRSGELGKLWQQIEDIAWLRVAILDIAKASRKVSSQKNNEVFSEHARDKLSECRGYLQDLSRGRLQITYSDNHLMLSAISRTFKNLRAVSVQSPKTGYSWWQFPIGKRYWEANFDALKRGVKVERIFVYEDWNDELEALASTQKEAGVAVYKIEALRLTPATRINSILFDDAFMYELRLSSDGEPAAHFFSADDEDNRRQIREFKAIMDSSDVFIPRRLSRPEAADVNAPTQA